MDALGDAKLICKLAQKILEIATAGDYDVRSWDTLQQQRHGFDQHTLALLRRQSTNIANQEIVGANAQLEANPLGVARPLACVRRLQAVIDAPHSTRVAHAA